MSATEVPSSDAAAGADVKNVDLKLEAIVIPVADVERSKAFYAGLGWRCGRRLLLRQRGQDRAVHAAGSPCSVQFGTGMTSAAPGSAENIYLIVADADAARAQLTARGAQVSERCFILDLRAPSSSPRDQATGSAVPRRTTPATPRLPRRAIRTATGGCCRRSRPVCPAGLRPPRPPSLLRATWPRRCGARRWRTASTRSSPASATRTGPTGTPPTWSPSRPAPSCRPERPRR